METKEERSFIDKVIIKWYQDPEVLQMLKKRVSTATAMMEIDSMKDVTAGQKKVKWFENPEILQILKTMFDPWLNEDGMPDATSLFSRCPRGFAKKNTQGPCLQLKMAKVIQVTNERITIGYDDWHWAAPTLEQHSALVTSFGLVALCDRSLGRRC
ncbi:uncharacterized protein LOC108866679 isoform X4 [Pyrus x bretschneideri]|uniref:uncharacterized protein LOC108866679 isoform X4 n=1 Tax=Pyrus x bretschneideri TaxID=225117 RepID=UPI0020307207|nr:uncharacterized protein LOC108866679 isoform X4 [Pyrus x bretschneideri]